MSDSVIAELIRLAEAGENKDMVEALGELWMFMLPEHIEGVDLLAEDTSCQLLESGRLGSMLDPSGQSGIIPATNRVA